MRSELCSAHNLGIEQMQPETDPFADWYIELARTELMPRPHDVAEGFIAYNPSAIAVERDEDGTDHHVVFLRVEPNEDDHIGKTSSIAYEIDPHNLQAPPRRYGEVELPGEDPSIKRIMVPGEDGNIAYKWLASTVVAERDRDAGAIRFATTFWLADSLKELRHSSLPFARIWGQKDVRAETFIDDTGVVRTLVIGRPQVSEHHGTLSQLELSSIYELSDEKMQAEARIIDENLYPSDPGHDLRTLRKGAANDVLYMGEGTLLIFGHEARLTAPSAYDGPLIDPLMLSGRHYEAVEYGYDRHHGVIQRLGTLAVRSNFPINTVKTYHLDVTDVVFTGGITHDSNRNIIPTRSTDAYDEFLVTCGLSDGAWGVMTIRTAPGLFGGRQSEGPAARQNTSRLGVDKAG